jgi:cysteine-rich repeat protein
MRQYDNGVNMTCSSCYLNCLTCTSQLANTCKSCDSTLFLTLSVVNGSSVGTCVCIQGYFMNSGSLCQACNSGCLSCTVAGGVQTCSSCNITSHHFLVLGSCQCQSGFFLAANNSCLPIICGDGIIETSEQCDDHNIVNGDGCSSTCQV